ncbi:uncharacterized protein METZ01_LOCUS380549 [marine metagenome]|uniref:Uncharacterized protein n=1 Tax=marine metagenome TaxID=408172 RepID=A0A382U191_9ZZZZ
MEADVPHVTVHICAGSRNKRPSAEETIHPMDVLLQPLHILWM